MSFRRRSSFAVCFALSCACLAWGASPPVRHALPKGLYSPFPAPPPTVRLSSGLSIDSSGNLLINAGGGAGTVLSNGLSLDSSGNLLVNCASGCSGGTPPGSPSGSIQGNNAGAFTAIPNATANFSTGQLQFTIPDLGGGNGIYVTDNSNGPVSGDQSYNLVADTGSANTSHHNPFAALIQGVPQLSICEQPGPQGETVFGSAVACGSINQSPFAKTVFQSLTAPHTIMRLFQASTVATGTMLQLANATAAGTTWKAFSLCAGATGNDTGCGSGTIVASLDGAGNLIVTSCTGCGATLPTPGASNLCFTSTGSSSGDWTWSACPSTVWNTLQNPAGNASFSMANYSSTFNYTSALSAAFAWINSTAATNSTNQNSPQLEVGSNYWNSSASAQNLWTLQQQCLSGNNPACNLVLASSGSSGGGSVLMPSAGTTGSGAGYYTYGQGSDPNLTTLGLLNQVGWGGPATVTTSYLCLMPGAVPTTGTNFMTCGGTADANGNYTGSWLNGIPLNDLAAAAAANTLANGNNPQTWNFAQTTNSQTGFSFGDTSAATGSSDILVGLSTATNSTETPLNISQGAMSTVFPAAALNISQASNTGATNVPGLNMAATWNNASLVGTLINLAITNTSTASGIKLHQRAGRDRRSD